MRIDLTDDHRHGSHHDLYDAAARIYKLFLGQPVDRPAWSYLPGDGCKFCIEAGKVGQMLITDLDDILQQQSL